MVPSDSASPTGEPSTSNDDADEVVSIPPAPFTQVDDESKEESDKEPSLSNPPDVTLPIGDDNIVEYVEDTFLLTPKEQCLTEMNAILASHGGNIGDIAMDSPYWDLVNRYRLFLNP